MKDSNYLYLGHMSIIETTSGTKRWGIKIGPACITCISIVEVVGGGGSKELSVTAAPLGPYMVGGGGGSLKRILREFSISKNICFHESLANIKQMTFQMFFKLC